jgi:hypothetical protein
LEQLQHMMWLNPQSQNYTLERILLKTRNTSTYMQWVEVTTALISMGLRNTFLSYIYIYNLFFSHKH